MAVTKIKQEAQNPLILRCHRLMEAFAKSDDERDFYIDRLEGFLIYVDLDKPITELESLDEELKKNNERYCGIPKLSFYETKKIMEGFVNEKVYDIDTKEKLLDIIQSKEARENFLEFIYDHHTEQEKWQQFYLERSRIRIIEWLRQNHFHFVFEEDLELPKQIIEKLKHSLFQVKVGKEIVNARKILVAKAKTYYSNEALNPRPKRGRPPKQVSKPEIEPQITLDIYTTVPITVRPFLFSPDFQPSSIFSGFSSKFSSEDDPSLSKRFANPDTSFNQKLASLRSLSNRWVEPSPSPIIESQKIDFNLDDDEEQEEEEGISKTKKTSNTKPSKLLNKSKASAKKTNTKSKARAPVKPKKVKPKRIAPSAKKESKSSLKPKVLKKISKNP